jgi:hypothetical protein
VGVADTCTDFHRPDDRVSVDGEAGCGGPHHASNAGELGVRLELDGRFGIAVSPLLREAPLKALAGGIAPRTGSFGSKKSFESEWVTLSKQEI